MHDVVPILAQQPAPAPAGPAPAGSDPIVTALLLGFGLMVVVLGLLAVVLRKRPAPPAPAPSLDIDLKGLGEVGPDPNGPTLEIHGVPVRLAAVVLAASGRSTDVPPAAELPALLDELVPGMSRIAGAHHTRFIIWPTQVSSTGFLSAFFARAKLPGDQGKGTPWCEIAGPFNPSRGKMLMGLVLRAAEPNSLSRYTLERETEWHQALRVRT